MTYTPKAAKAHVVYKNAAGKRIPGVTTIVGQRAKNLERWVARLVKDGYDYDEYMRDVANVGKCAHEMVMAELQGREPEIDDFTAEQQRWARVSANRVIEWATRPGIDFEILESEVEMVSEAWQVGGTMDIYCRLGGRYGVLDLKTSDSGIYLDNLYQVAAYGELAAELGKRVDFVGVIRSAKDEAQPLQEVIIDFLSDNCIALTQGFIDLTRAYERDKRIRRELGVK